MRTCWILSPARDAERQQDRLCAVRVWRFVLGIGHWKFKVWVDLSRRHGESQSHRGQSSQRKKMKQPNQQGRL
ncbi:hypothetical protein SRHO_G00228880 [Serrasalmus rhombeus]